MNELHIFNSEEFGDIRTVTIDNEPWFVGKDVATALGYKNTADAIGKHIDTDDKLTSQIAIAGQRRDVVVINESGLYALILGSKLESAKRFKRWVTSEVLPAIRKTGSYQKPMTLAEQIQLLARGNENHEERNEGKPTIGTLARQLYNECQIKLCEHEVEILRKYSLFEEGDPYD